MQIFVDGKLAVLKKNTSFDYVSENSLFTGSDSYSMTITFPMKNCAQNMGIFGWITRKDSNKDNIVMDCEMRDKSFYKSGCITVTEVSDEEIKAQFLEGRSASNFDVSFDTIFINRLSLGYAQSRNPANVTVAQAWAYYPNVQQVALPWVNNTSGNIQNQDNVNRSSGLCDGGLARRKRLEGNRIVAAHRPRHRLGSLHAAFFVISLRIQGKGGSQQSYPERYIFKSILHGIFHFYYFALISLPTALDQAVQQSTSVPFTVVGMAWTTTSITRCTPTAS